MEINDIILNMGDEFVKIMKVLNIYSAVGLFKTPGKSKNSKQQEIRYFDDSTPLGAIIKLQDALSRHRALFNKKI